MRADSSFRWLGCLVLVAVAATPLLVVCAPAEAGSDGGREQRAGRIRREAEIFFLTTATDTQVRVVGRDLERSSFVDHYAFVSQRAARMEYEKLRRHDPTLPRLTAVDELPASFLVDLKHVRDDAAFTHQFEEAAGVDSINSRTTLLRQQRARACHTPADVEAFLSVAASQSEIDVVSAALALVPQVATSTFVTHEVAYQTYQCIFAVEPSYAGLVQPQDLPVSFRLTALPGVDVALLAQRVSAIPGVDSVQTIAAPKPVAVA
jgi:cell division protein FtsX